MSFRPARGASPRRLANASRRGVGVAILSLGFTGLGASAAQTVSATPTSTGIRAVELPLTRSDASPRSHDNPAWLALRGGDYRNAYLAFRAAGLAASTEAERASAALGACEALLVDGLADEAIDQLSNWIDAYPDDPKQFAARIMLARALEASPRQGSDEAAVSAWREVLYVGSVPCADAVRIRLSMLLASLGREDEAAAEVRNAGAIVAGSDSTFSSRLLVAEAGLGRPGLSRDPARAAALAEEAFTAIVNVGRLPDDTAEAAWRVVSSASASGNRARADAVRWQIIGEWPETPSALRAVTELGPDKVPATARATIAAANGRWEAVRDATRWVLANAPADPAVGQARALRGIAANAIREPGAELLLDEGGGSEAGSKWGARAILEAAERRWTAKDTQGAVARYAKLATTFPDTLEAGQANYQLGRILPSLGEMTRAVHAMNLAADVGPVGFHTVRAREILRRASPRPPASTEAFVESGVITPSDLAEWETWLRVRSLAAPANSGELTAPDLQVAVDRLDGLLAGGLFAEAVDGAREICQRRGYAPATIAAVADRLRTGGLLTFSMTLGHRLLRVLEAAGETSTLALPAVPKKLAFPLAYPRLVRDSASRENVDPYLLLALMKQESWFDPRAQSTASARGLTQFIRPTATAVARELNWPNWAWDDLFRPYVAVPFGARYLGSLLRDFRGNVLFATAAYNAGPSPVLKWIGGDWGQDPDQFVAGITYGETRTYVTTIATYAEVYRDTYGTA